MFGDERARAKEISLFLVWLPCQGSAVSETTKLETHVRMCRRLTGFALDVADFSSMNGIWCISTCWFRISSRIEIILNSWHRTRRLKMLLFGFCCIYCMLQMLQIYCHLHYFTPSTKRRDSNVKNVSWAVLVPRLATKVLRWSRSGKTSHQDRSMAALLGWNVPNYEPDVITNELRLLKNIVNTHFFFICGSHLQIAENAEQEHFQSPFAVSGIRNNFNPTRNSESARRNAPDCVNAGEIRDIKCKTGQPNVQSSHLRLL